MLEKIQYAVHDAGRHALLLLQTFHLHDLVTPAHPMHQMRAHTQFHEVTQSMMIQVLQDVVQLVAQPHALGQHQVFDGQGLQTLGHQAAQQLHAHCIARPARQDAHRRSLGLPESSSPACPLP